MHVQAVEGAEFDGFDFGKPPDNDATLEDLNNWADLVAVKVQLLAPEFLEFECCWQVVDMLGDEEVTVSGQHVYYSLLREATQA